VIENRNVYLLKCVTCVIIVMLSLSSGCCVSHIWPS